MKFSSMEEYGLRFLILLANQGPDGAMTIPEVADAEKVSEANVGKIMRLLRTGGFVEAQRGASGGYRLAKSPYDIYVGEALAHLGGRLFDQEFCRRFTGIDSICTHTTHCTIKSLWDRIQTAVDDVVMTMTLAELMHAEKAGWSVPETQKIEHISAAR